MSGKEIQLNDDAYTIVGVMPRDFTFVEQPVDAYVPLRLSDTLGDKGTNTRVVARLKPGVGITQAQTEMNIVFAQFPEKDSGLFVGDYHPWLPRAFPPTLFMPFLPA